MKIARLMTLLFIACPALCGARSAAAATSYRLALPGYRYQFPRDHASHPAFNNEWWYYTGHLQSTNKNSRRRRFGYQLTFFRIALKPNLTGRKSKWAVRDVIFVHFTVTDENNQKFYVMDRISRTALGLAGADSINSIKKNPKLPRIWLGDWTLRFSGKTGEQQIMRAAGHSNGIRLAIDLQQRALKLPTIHGQNGVSQKAAGQGRASHYYSFTSLATHGTVQVGDERYTVTGQSWFDHEFGSNQLTKNQVGWDWFSLQLADGREIMLYNMRLRNGGIDPYSSGTLVERNGQARHLKLQNFRVQPLATWRSAQSGATYPARWRVTLPREGIHLEITPTVANQELNTKRSVGVNYWEGSVRIAGTQRGRALSGSGYVELTGYAGAFDRTF